MSVSELPPNARYGHTAAVSVRRLVNDEIVNAAGRFDDGGTVFAFICECGDLGCRALVKMTLAEYRLTTPGSVVGHD